MLKQFSSPYLESHQGDKKGSFKAKWKKEKGCNPTNQALIPMLKLLAVCAGPVVMDAFIMLASSHGHADGVLLCLSPHGPAGQRLARRSAFPAWRQTRPVFFHNHTDPHSSNSTNDMLSQTLHRTPLTTTTTTTNVPHR